MKYIYISLFLFSSFPAFNQNIIDNGSFENGLYNFYQETYKKFWSLTDWKADTYIDNSINHTGHSPDWMIEAYYNNQPDAKDGDYHVHILSGELFDQKISPTKGQSYIITAWIYLMSNYSYGNQSLFFYLGENEFKYEYDLTSIAPCAQDYALLQENDYILLNSTSLNNLNRREWLKIEFIYNHPSDGQPNSDFTWLGIEMKDASNLTLCAGEPLLIDNISMIETDLCTFEPCIRTTGPPEPTSPYRYQSQDGPIAVSNLDNIEKATNIKIYSIAGGVLSLFEILPDVNSSGGIIHPIFWNRGANGAAAEPGTYYWEMYLTNECGTFLYREDFVLTTSMVVPIPQFPNYNTSIITPLPCCELEQDIVIDYNLYGAGIIDFKATNNIILEDMTVENTVDNLLLQEGNEVIISPGVTFELGAVVEIIVEPCNE